jgi:hypothetical protein
MVCGHSIALYAVVPDKEDCTSSRVRKPKPWDAARECLHHLAKLEDFMNDSQVQEEQGIMRRWYAVQLGDHQIRAVNADVVVLEIRGFTQLSRSY